MAFKSADGPSPSSHCPRSGRESTSGRTTACCFSVRRLTLQREVAASPGPRTSDRGGKTWEVSLFFLHPLNVVLYSVLSRTSMNHVWDMLSPLSRTPPLHSGVARAHAAKRHEENGERRSLSFRLIVIRRKEERTDGRKAERRLGARRSLAQPPPVRPSVRPSEGEPGNKQRPEGATEGGREAMREEGTPGRRRRRQ